MNSPGKPAFDILQSWWKTSWVWNLLTLEFIAEMLGVSRWNISRRIKDYGLEDFRSFSYSKLPDDKSASQCCFTILSSTFDWEIWSVL